MNYKSLAAYLSALCFSVFLLAVPELFFASEKNDQQPVLRVMTYSSFIQKWGAGPEIADHFFKETGIKIRWINAGNAGLLLERLKFKKDSDRPDVVVGLDQFSIFAAKKSFEWLNLKDVAGQERALPVKGAHLGFLAYDWGPLTFIYRENRVQPPKNLMDLTSKRFKKRLILQDPRMSSPGLQFLLWVVKELGEDQAFQFLQDLKPSIQIMSPSWSSSYSLFKMEKRSLVFSYFTSPFYHQLEEQDTTYRAVKVQGKHPLQIEYAGVLRDCNFCTEAQKFVLFLRRPEIQKILMEKNYMYPVAKSALNGSSFSLPEGVSYLDPMMNLSLIKKKKELVARWKKIFY